MIRRLFVVALLLAVIVAGVMVGYRVLMSPEYGQRLLARIDETMPFRIAAVTPPESAFLPLPHVLLRDAVLSFPDMPFSAEARQVRFDMDLLSLVRGAPSGIELQIDDMTLRGGEGSFTPGVLALLLADLSGRLAGNGDWRRIRINTLRLESADAAASPLPAIAGLTITRKGRQVDIDMDGQANGSGFIMWMNTLPSAEGRRLQASLRLLEGGVRITADARFVPGKPLRGRFTGELDDPSRLLLPAEGLKNILPAGPVRGSGQFILGAASLNVAEGEFSAGEEKIRLKGRFPFNRRDGGGFSADLTLSHMEIGRSLLRRLAGLGGFDGGKVTAMADLRGRFTVSADALSVNDGLLRAVRLRGVFVPDGLIVEDLAANLPGEGRLQLSGKLRPGRFQGSLSLSADNFRALLGWLGVGTAAIAPQRLRAATMVTGIDLDRDNLRLQGFSGQIDGAKISGAATIGLRRRPSFALNVALDRADLDAYFPALRGGVSEALATAYCGGPLTGLTVLRRFDTNTRIEAAELMAGGRRYRNARIDVALFNGDLVLNDLRLDDTAGNHIALSGRVRADKTPSLKLRGQARIAAADGLGATLAGTGLLKEALPFDGDVFLGMKAAEPCAIDLKGRIAGGLGRVAARADGNGVRSMDAGISNLPLRRLREWHPLFAILNPTGRSADMQLRLEEGSGREKAGAPAMLALRWPGEMRLEAMGRWKGDERRFTGRLRLEAPEAKRLVRLLSGNELPLTDKTIGAGAFSGDAVITAEGLSMSDFSLLLGPLSARGSVRLTGYPRRPALSADLAFGHVPLGQVLKLPQSGIDGWRRWAQSAEPLSLSLPERLNARIALVAKSLEAGPWRLSDIGLTLRIDPEALRIEQAAATGFGGGIMFSASLRDGDPPALNGTLSLTGIDLARLTDVLKPPYLREAVLDGRADLSLRLQGQGYAPAGLFTSLRGEYRLAAGGLRIVPRQRAETGGENDDAAQPLRLSLPDVTGRIRDGAVIISPVTITAQRQGQHARLVLRRGRLLLSDATLDILLDADMPWRRNPRTRWRISGQILAPETAVLPPFSASSFRQAAPALEE